MTLKVKRTHIQDGCTVSFGATVMGGAIMEEDTTLLPLSLVLKEMNLTTATYEGSPAEPVSGSILLAQAPWNGDVANLATGAEKSIQADRREEGSLTGAILSRQLDRGSA